MSASIPPSTTQPDAAAAQSRATDPPRRRVPRATPPPVSWRFGANLARASGAPPYRRRRDDPLYRPLRIYALDPTQSKLDGAVAVVNVPYEPLDLGPVGSLFEIDPGVGPLSHADALDLNALRVALTQGVEPSPSRAHFHQQMAYAVCSSVYNAFRQALGRDLSWGFVQREGVPDRLRILPFGYVGANAFYNHKEGTIRFGYFEAVRSTSGRTPAGTQVFTSLSHDILAHELTHAMLDGLRPSFTFPSHIDVPAFHEGFADLVALFQHFSYPEVVRAAIRSSKGDLRLKTVVSGIAKQFGETTGLKGSMRTAIDFGQGIPTAQYDETKEAHELGAVLVAAVFDAFTRVFSRKTAQLRRLASVSEEDSRAVTALPEALQMMLADEAAKLAGQFLGICIRAIDYSPPVDMRLGDYLRAVITADRDLVPDDPLAYREAWTDAFRERGIFPGNVKHFSEDDLLWATPSNPELIEIPGLAFDKLQFNGDPGHAMAPREAERQARALAEVVFQKRFLDQVGMIDPASVSGDEAVDAPVVESIRTSRRIGPDRQVTFDLIAEVTQQRLAKVAGTRMPFIGGATLVIGPDGTIRYVIGRGIASQKRLQEQHAFATRAGSNWWKAEHGEVWPITDVAQQLHNLRGFVEE